MNYALSALSPDSVDCWTFYNKTPPADIKSWIISSLHLKNRCLLPSFNKKQLFFTNQVNVSCLLPGDAALTQSVSGSGNVPSSRGSSRVGSSDDDAPSTPPVPCISQTSSSTRGLSLLDYPGYMARLLATEELSPFSSTGASSAETSPTIKENVRHACR